MDPLPSLSASAGIEYPQFVSETTQPAFTWSKLTIETLEQGVKYAQS